MLSSLLVASALVSPMLANPAHPSIRVSCTFTDAATAIKQKTSCSAIVLSNIAVPAGQTLDLTGLKSGTHVTFQGTTTFGYKEWQGPLISVSGAQITVDGAAGHTIDCQGQRWWDGQGSNGGKTKPKFFAAHHISNSHQATQLVLDSIQIDSSLGDTKGGHNTDGFNVGSSTGVAITSAVVKNQDDCLAINSGTNISFVGGTCSGGHGLSISSVGGRSDNIVKNIRVAQSSVSNSENGVRIKTVSKATGSVSDVTYEDITLSNINTYGIVVEQDYLNGGPTGTPTGGVPITGLTMNNVHGSVKAGGTNVYILCTNASGWNWSRISVTGGTKLKQCQGIPKNSGAVCS